MSAAEIAQQYRADVLARGDRAELAAIDGMPDEFVAAIASGDPAAATAAIEQGAS